MIHPLLPKPIQGQNRRGTNGSPHGRWRPSTSAPFARSNSPVAECGSRRPTALVSPDRTCDSRMSYFGESLSGFPGPPGPGSWRSLPQRLNRSRVTPLKSHSLNFRKVCACASSAAPHHWADGAPVLSQDSVQLPG